MIRSDLKAGPTESWIPEDEEWETKYISITAAMKGGSFHHLGTHGEPEVQRTGGSKDHVLKSSAITLVGPGM